MAPDSDELALGGDRHLESLLMRDSLLSEATRRKTQRDVIPLLPSVAVIKIGGRSIIDWGSERLPAVLDEVVAAFSSRKVVIGAGSGVRSRHVFGVGLDLGLPTGVLAALSSTDSEQNAHMIAAMLARHGVVSLPPPFVTHLLPAMLAVSNGVVVNGVPPFELWEHPAAVGKIPPNRTDAGMYLLAEVYGADRVIYVKDVDGLYTADPKQAPEAEHVPRVSVPRLREMDLRTLPVDELVLDLLERGHHCRMVQIVNGTTPGMLTKALAGELVGTVITSADE